MEFLKVFTTALISVFKTLFEASRKRKAIRQQEKNLHNREVSHFFSKLDTASIECLNEALKQYITLVQRTKDQLRIIIQTFEYSDREEIFLQLLQLRGDLVDTYATLCTSFESTPFHGRAHSIKTDLLNIILALGKPDPFDPEEQLEAIRLVAVHQQQLCTGVRHVLVQMRTSLLQSCQ